MNPDQLGPRLDAALFAKHRLGFHPDPKQTVVLRPGIRRGLLNCTRQWGKSTVTAIKAVHHAWAYADSLVLAVSPSQRQSAEFVRKARRFLAALGLSVRKDPNHSVSAVLSNGSRIIGLPGKEDTIRGFSGVSLLLIDEAAAVPDELYHAVNPMVAASEGSLWMMSTPRGKAGFFYEAWSRGGADWTRITVPATECLRLKPAELDRQRRALGDRVFRQEFLCEFVDAHGQMIRDDFIEAAISTAITPLVLDPGRPRVLEGGVSYFIGVDLGQSQDYTAIAILERRVTLTGRRNPVTWEQERQIRYDIRYLSRLELGTPYAEVARHISTLVRVPQLVGNCTLIVDATGVGAGVLELLRRERMACPLVPVTITGGARAQETSHGWHVPKRDLIVGLQLRLEDGSLRIAAGLEEGPAFIKELRGMRVRISTAGNELYESWRDGAHDDLVLAAALASWKAT